MRYKKRWAGKGNQKQARRFFFFPGQVEPSRGDTSVRGEGKTAGLNSTKKSRGRKRTTSTTKP